MLVIMRYFPETVLRPEIIWRRYGKFALVAIVTLLTVIGVWFSGYAQAQRPLQVRIERWLALQQLSGEVTYYNGSSNRPATVGDRLRQVGDGIRTGQQSSALLAVDTGIGFVEVSEDTQLRVRSLDVAPDNGHITHLQLDRGQARLRVRSFTHEGSDLEIHTPAGVSGVRGTEFGLAVHPDGATGLATLEGQVDSLAQGVAIQVPQGFQNLTIPGEPPQPPVPLRDDPSLRYEIRRFLDGTRRRARFIGQVDPVNVVLVDGEPQVTDRDGRFGVWLPLRNVVRLEVRVITPLGREEVYDLPLAL